MPLHPVSYYPSPVSSIRLADAPANNDTPPPPLNHQTSQTLAKLFSDLIPAFEKIFKQHRLEPRNSALERLALEIGALRNGAGKGEYLDECKNVLDKILLSVSEETGLETQEYVACKKILFTEIDEICQGSNQSTEEAENKKIAEFIQSYSDRLDEAVSCFNPLHDNMMMRVNQYSQLQNMEEFGMAADCDPTYREEVVNYFCDLDADRKARLIDEAMSGISEPGIRFAFESGEIDPARLVNLQTIDHNYFKTSVLGLAAYYGYAKEVRILLGQGVSSPSEVPPLTMAAWRGHLDVVKVLLDVPGLDLNRLPDEGHVFFQNCSALSAAADAGHVEVVEALVQRGANPNVGSRPALHAALINPHITPLARITIFNILLQTPDINVNAVYEDKTALTKAAELGYLQIVDTLSVHPDINPNIGGFSALIFAAEMGNIRSVELLLKIPGIDATRTHYDGETASMAAQEYGHTEIIKLLEAHLNKPDLPPLQNAITKG